MAACEHPRTVGDQPALAKSRDTTAALITRHECGVLLFDADCEPRGRGRKLRTVDFDVEATMAGMDLDCDPSVVRDDQGRSTSSVHGQGRTDERSCARCEQRAA